MKLLTSGLAAAGKIRELVAEKVSGMPVLAARDALPWKVLRLVLSFVLYTFASIWILGSCIALFLNTWYGTLEAFGRSVPEIQPASWYLTHPFHVAGSWMSHLFFGTPVADPQIFRGWLALYLILVVFVLIPGYIFRYGHSQLGKLKMDRSRIHGSAQFLDPVAAKEYLQFKYVPGLILGAIPGAGGMKPAVLKETAPGNRNVAVFGPPGSMKSAGYIRNNLFQALKSNCSVIVTDPKGELVRDFRRWFEEKGYTVKVFNLVSMLNSDRWNPLHEVHDDITAQHFCSVVIANTSVPGRKGGDPFWDRLEMNLLKALVLYVINELPDNKNLGVVYNLLACGDSSQLDDLFAGLPIDHPARLPYNLFRETSGTVRSGAIIGLGTRLEVFQNQLVRELTAANEIDLELPGKEKCAYFCILSDTDSTFNFLASLYFSFLFINLTRLADKQPDGRLRVPVNFLLDEFCNIPGIPDFTKKISTMRGRGIACSVIFQNIPQLIQTYGGQEWEIILGDCDYWLILGAKEKSSADYISKILGTTTVESISDRRPKGIESINPWAGSVVVSPTRRALLELSEVSRMASDECIVRFNDGQVVRLKKLFFKNHPWAKELKPEHIGGYWPAWAVDFKRLNEGDANELSPVNLIFPEMMPDWDELKRANGKEVTPDSGAAGAEEDAGAEPAQAAEETLNEPGVDARKAWFQEELIVPGEMPVDPPEQTTPRKGRGRSKSKPDKPQSDQFYQSQFWVGDQ